MSAPNPTGGTPALKPGDMDPVKPKSHDISNPTTDAVNGASLTQTKAVTTVTPTKSSIKKCDDKKPVYFDINGKDAMRSDHSSDTTARSDHSSDTTATSDKDAAKAASPAKKPEKEKRGQKKRGQNKSEQKHRADKDAAETDKNSDNVVNKPASTETPAPKEKSDTNVETIVVEPKTSTTEDTAATDEAIAKENSEPQKEKASEVTPRVQAGEVGEDPMDVTPAETVDVAAKPLQSRKRSTTDSSEKTPTHKRTRSPSAATPSSPATPDEGGRVKRQRRQVEKFQAATPTQDAASPPCPTSIKLYDKNTTLAVRADGATFYLCRCMNTVFNTQKRFKIRWFEIEQTPDLYRLAYEDRVELECVIGPAHIQRAKGGLLRLTTPELTRIQQLIKAAEKGEDVTKLDPELFKPQTQSVKRVAAAAKVTEEKEATVEDGDDDTDIEPEKEEPTPKRPRRSAAQGVAATPKEKPARRVRIPKTDTPKKDTPKVPRAVKGTAKKAAGGKARLKKVVSIAQAAPALRRTATLQLSSGQKKPSFFNRPSFLRKISLQKWPSLKVKPKRAKLGPGAPKPCRPPVDPNRKLKHNPRITVWEKDPLFESRLEVPFVSAMMHSCLAIRAVNLKDKDLLKTVIEDTKQVAKVDVQKSCHSDKTTMTYAVLSEQRDVMKMLHDNVSCYRSRIHIPASLMRTMGTGTYNPRTLPGVKAVRKLNVSRGGREGNNALTKDRSRTYSPDMATILIKALEENVSYETLKYMVDFKIADRDVLYGLIHQAVRYGHRKLASQLVEDAAKASVWGFNFMHKEVLKFNDGEDFSGKLLEASVLKQPVENAKMRPIHCAAINPNTKYLSTMLSITSDWNKEDADGRRPIHYAAACEEIGPLKLLIDKHVALNEADSKGYTPLTVACITGRAHNVRLILDHLIEEEKSLQGEMADEFVKRKPPKFGPGGVNRPMKNTWCPIHFAAANKRKDVIQVLVERGADVNKNVGANFNRITPLIMAAQDGDLSLVRFLIEKGAKIEKPDKLKRTALTHAVRDGNAHVASYLLNRGADPNTTDSSGNTALHYAAAYGWYFCMKALLDAGANPDPPNDWKLTPLGASFLKGNHGLTKILMDIPGVNIDFQDDEGMTLLHHTLDRVNYSKETVQEVKLLVVQKKANVKLLDKKGRNAIHCVFDQPLLREHDWNISIKADTNSNMTWEDVRSQSIAVLNEVLDLLMNNGCDPWLKNGSSRNIFDSTFEHMKDVRPLPLLKHVMSKKPWLPEIVEGAEDTLLHDLVSDLHDKDKLDMIHQISKLEVDGRSGIELLRTMARTRCESYGKTPLIKVCKSYKDIKPQVTYRSWYHNEAQENLEEVLENGRAMIKYLIEDLKSELEYVIEEEKTKPGRTYTVLESLLCASCDLDKFQALDMVLSYKPNVDFMRQGGRTLLMKSVWEGNERAVKKLLAVGANVNLKSEEKDGSRMTPLLMCLETANVHLLPILLENGADRSAITENMHESVFHIAIKNCDDVLNILQQLMTKNSIINVADKKLRTPLHLVMNRSTDSPDESKKLEHFLLKNGADPFLKDIRGRMPIHYLFVKIGCNNLKRAIDPVESYSIMNIAMKNQRLDEPDVFGQTPLHRAAYRGATVCAMLLIQRGCNVNTKDKDGNTPLSLAVWNCHDSCALMMIQKGADINGDVITDPTADINPNSKKPEENVSNGLVIVMNNANSHSGSSSRSGSGSGSDDGSSKGDINQVVTHNIRRIEDKPVWKHASRHFPKPWKPGKKGYPIFQGLVINGWQGLTFLAMDLLEPFGMHYASVVEIAIGLGKFTFAMNLMEKQLDNEKLRVKNEKGQTLLHAMALNPSSSNEELQELIIEDLMLERKVNVNIQDANGFTALHHAILNQNDTCAYLLLNYEDVNMNLNDKFGRNPIAALIWLQTRGHGNEEFRSLCKQMLNRGAKTDLLVDYPPLSVLCKGYEPQVDVSDYYRSYDNTKTTPLILAVVRRRHHVVQDLLRAGASPNFADSTGKTPLMYAVQTGDILLVRLLLDRNTVIDTYRQEIEAEHQRIKMGEVPAPLSTDEDLFAGIKSVEKRSTLDVNSVDLEGRTAVHHLLTTLRYGAYKNLRILKMLSDAKATLNVKDKAGRTPIDLAIRRGARTIAKGLQSLLEIPKDEWRVPTCEPFTVEDGITWPGPGPDYVADASAMLTVIEEEEARLAALQPRAIPDSRLGLDMAVVCMDEEIDMPYDILMTKVDVKMGEFGLYNFYKMQVVCDTTKDLYLLFNCWGRIGDPGQFQQTPFKSEEAAKEEFAKIFKAKSGNEWKNIKEFEIKPKRYRLVEADYRRRNTPVQVQYDLTSTLPSKLPPYVQDLMAELSNVSMLRTMMKNIGTDIPFGRLKKDNLIKAREILVDLLDLSQKVDDYEADLTTENIEDYRAVCEQVAELSSEYYYLVPVSGKQYEALVPLKCHRTVKNRMKNLSDLLELEFTGTMLLGAQHRINEVNPYDYLYRAIQARIQQLPEDNAEAQTILSYVTSTSSNRDVEAIYRVERHGEPERLASCGVTENHSLLWHGSRTSNLLSILSRGLLIAPKDAPMSGMAFGKGIYTADCFSKSEGYCYNDGNGKSRYMLLCEVALGTIGHVDSSGELSDVLPPEGTNSVQANGRQAPDPTYDAILPTGTEIPLGPLTESSTPLTEASRNRTYYGSYNRVSYNEFIVYNEDRVCLRYIVQFR